MEIISTAPAATAAKANANNQAMANANYTKSLMASRALQSSGGNNEVNVANLEKGDVFKGEITNITGRTVTVSLGSGQMLTALMLENVPINIGNNLYFEVKENDGERITIRPLLDEKFSPQNQTIEKSLQSAGLQLNEKNMAVVKELMDASMPIDRNSIMKILQQLVNHPEAGIKTIVGMTKCNLPITEGNIVQFEQYATKQHQLTNQMEQVTESISKMFQSYGSEEAFAGDILRLNQGMVNIFAEQGEGVNLPVLPLSQAFAMSDTEVAAFLEETMAFEMDAKGQTIVDSLGNRYPQGSLLMDDFGKPVLDSNGQLVFTDSFLEQMSETQKQALLEGQFYNVESGEKAQYSNEIQARFAQLLKNLGISDDAVKMMLHPSNTAQDLMKSIQDYVSNDMELSDDTIKQFFSSREYGVLLESVISNQWKLKPEQLKNKEEVLNLFQRLGEQSSRLADLGKQFSAAGEQMSDQAENMRQNLDFMQMLNDKYTYAQLPLQLTNQDANGELYVYTNKKALEKNKKEISVLLHLDMTNLGSTDVHVQLNGTKVMARFYMDDQRSLNTVKNHIYQLQERIERIGLTLEAEVVRRVEKKEQVEDFVEDFLAKDLPASQQVKRYTFDMRA